MSALNKAHTPVEVDRFFPSTKRCSGCGAINEIDLDEQVYHCKSCGLGINRHLNAAVNVEVEGLKQVPTERREVTPVDTKTAAELVEYFNGIPRVRASLVAEAGSPAL